MKRILLLTFVVFLVTGLILTGCSSSPASPTPSPTISPGITPASSPAPVSSATPKPSGTAAPVATKVWELKLAHEDPPQSYFQIYGKEPWAKAVEKATNGRVKITIYPAQTLCKAKDTLEAVRTGVADIGRAYLGYYPGVFPLSEYMFLPFLGITSGEVAGRIGWEMYEKFPEIQAEYKAQHVKCLAVPTTDINFLATSKKPVRKLEDFKGLKLRVPAGPPTDMMTRLGASPMNAAMADMYLNLQKGVMDGMAHMAYPVVAFKHYEVLKYYTMVSLFTGSFLYIMNEDVWNSMPADIQQQIMSVSGLSLSEMIGREVFDRAVKEMPDQIKQAGYQAEYINLTPEELNNWIAVGGKPVWDAWATKAESIGLPGKKVLDETLRLVEKYRK